MYATSLLVARPFQTQAAGTRPARAAFAVRAASGYDSTPADTEGKRKGVLPGLASWPPKPFTSHGVPKPEDDPLNYDGEKRVRGPPDSEIQARRSEQAKNSPWSNPSRSGGTQAGGGGEGSAS
ncbi:hypothetical protein WJX81_007750 [Elliptochloris bilobata]|uniref:Uncharacterized protein n=1 Tax=Elliptochloris bilobata TaxID=381761 RepID=A0AAW1SIJ4_9CHLO